MGLFEFVVGDVTIPTQDIKSNQCCSRRISQLDCSIHIKLNYSLLISLKICKNAINIFFENIPVTLLFDRNIALIWLGVTCQLILSQKKGNVCLFYILTTINSIYFRYQKLIIFLCGKRREKIILPGNWKYVKIRWPR
jgi:hypothetical protein